MMEIVSVCGIALIAILLSSVLKQFKKEYAVFLSIILGIVLLKYSITVLSDKLNFFNSIIKNSSVGDFGEVLLKTFGVSLVVETASDICKDAGESSIASKIELIGKIEILIIGIPLIERIIQITKDIML